MPLEEFVPLGASFLFVFAIIYALLLKARVLGEAKNAGAMVAAAIAAIAVLHGPTVTFLTGIMPIAAVILVVLFLILFARDIFAFKGGDGDNLPEVSLLFISLLVLAAVYPRIAPLITFMDSSTAMFIAGLVAVSLLFYAIYKHKPAH